MLPFYNTKNNTDISSHFDAVRSESYIEANANILFLCKGSRNLVLLPAHKISLSLTNVFVCFCPFILASRRLFSIASVAKSFVAIFCSLICY